MDLKANNLRNITPLKNQYPKNIEEMDWHWDIEGFKSSALADFHILKDTRVFTQTTAALSECELTVNEKK